MTTAVLKDAYFDWVQSATGLATAKIIFLNQDFKRPDRDYISLFMSDFVEIGDQYTSHPNNTTGAAVIVQDWEHTLQIQAIGDKLGVVDPIERLLNLQASLGMINKYKILQDAGIAFVNSLLGPIDISGLKDVGFEPRAALDLKFRLPWDITDPDQGVIEKTIIESTVVSPNLVDQTISLITVDSTP